MEAISLGEAGVEKKTTTKNCNSCILLFKYFLNLIYTTQELHLAMYTCLEGIQHILFGLLSCHGLYT